MSQEKLIVVRMTLLWFFAIDKLHAERCARCNSSDFSKGEVKVKEIKMDKEKVILISNMGA